MKKIILSILLFLGIISFAHATVFNSNQIATGTPTTNFIILSQGNNTPAEWFATSSLGFPSVANYITFDYASSTFNNFTYSSSTFVSFGYASSTFASTSGLVANYVPYTGATKSVNLNNQSLANVSTLSVGTTTAPTGGVAYFNGNVGIGSSTPSAPLTIGYDSGTISQPDISLGSGAASDNYIAIDNRGFVGYNNTDLALLFQGGNNAGSNSAKGMDFMVGVNGVASANWNSGTMAMEILPTSADILIGTTTVQTSALYVQATSTKNTLPLFTVASSTGATDFTVLGNGTVQLPLLATAGGSLLAVDGNGNIIASTSPSGGGTVTSVGIVPVTGQTASAAITTSGNITISTTAGYTSAFTTKVNQTGTTFSLSTTSSSLILNFPNTTGSGNWVQATSPTLTTPILGVASGTAMSLSGAEYVTGTSTLASTTITHLVLGDGLTKSFLAVDAFGNVIATTSPTNGTVTSVAITAPTGITVSGSPITTSGTLGLACTSAYTCDFTSVLTTSGTAFTLSTTSSSLIINVPANLLSTTTAATTYVPYTGATSNVNLGANALTLTGQFTANFASTTAFSDSGQLYVSATSTLASTTMSGFLEIGTTVPFSQGTLATGDYAPLYLTGSTTNAFEPNVQNTSASATSTSEWVATANGGNDLKYWESTGINGSNYNDPAYTSESPYDAFLISSDGNVDIDAATTSGSVKIVTGGTTAAKINTTFTSGGSVGIATTNISNPLTVGTTTTGGQSSAYFTGGIAQRIVGYTASTSQTINTDILDIATTTFSYATTTLNNPLGTPHDGQMFVWQGFATTSQAVAFGSIFATSTDVTSFPSAIASGTVQFLFQYRKAQGTWIILGQ